MKRLRPAYATDAFPARETLADRHKRSWWMLLANLYRPLKLRVHRSFWEQLTHHIVMNHLQRKYEGTVSEEPKHVPFFRPLVEEEVTFVVTCEPETDIPVKGNALVSGDDDLDLRVENEILEELKSGNYKMWCCLKVKATWGSWSVTDYLGACSLAETDSIEEAARDHGMYDEALKGLNEVIEQDLKLLKERG